MTKKLAKKIRQAFSPKRITKATKKVIPKVATGGLLIGAGIGANKLMTDMEDQPAIIAEAPEDSNLVDRSYSFIKVERPKRSSHGTSSCQYHHHDDTYPHWDDLSHIHRIQEDHLVPEQAEADQHRGEEIREKQLSGTNYRQGSAKVLQSEHHGGQERSRGGVIG